MSEKGRNHWKCPICAKWTNGAIMCGKCRAPIYEIRAHMRQEGIENADVPKLQAGNRMYHVGDMESNAYRRQAGSQGLDRHHQRIRIYPAAESPRDAKPAQIQQPLFHLPGRRELAPQVAGRELNLARELPGRWIGPAPYPSPFEGLEGGPFDVILADSPWAYNDASRNRGGALRHYQTQSDEWIQSLPVRELAAPDCALFLWATWPKLPEALATMAAWGFTYKTVAFVWVKTTKVQKAIGWLLRKLSWGMGHWTRANTEPILLGTRGKPKRADAGIHQVIMSPRRKHSEKPPEAHRQIEKLIQAEQRL